MVVGSRLPSIAASSLKFLRGKPVDLPPSGQPLILELWATWCGPCRAVFPHLSAIAEKHASAGLQVLGLSVEDPSPAVEQFVERQKSVMRYSVALDSRGAVGQQLMELAQVSGIPHSFVVDRVGTIVFSGHPADPAFQQSVAQVCQRDAEAKASQEFPAVQETREQLASKPVGVLKAILKDRGISYADLSEKREFVDRIIERCSNVTYYGSMPG